MKKSSSKKKAEPPRRSTVDEVLEEMSKRGDFSNKHNCLYHRHGLYTGLYDRFDDVCRCLLNRQTDEESGEDFYGECGFKGNNHENCLKYKNELKKQERGVRGNG